MDTYIVWTADKLGPKIETAFIGDNVAEIGILNQHVQHGNSLLKGWIENAAGRIILMNGITGAAAVPDSFLAGLSNLQAQISALWDDTLSFGVSLSLKEANRAMQVAKERGGNRVLWYTPDLDRVQAPSEEDSLAALKPVTKAEGGEQSAASQFMEVPQEQPAAAQDAPAQPAEGGPDQIKTIVMEILKKIKSQKKTLDQLKVQAPDTYKAILGAVQAMIVMARAMSDGAPGEGGEQAPQDTSAADQAGQQQDLQEQAVQNEQEVAKGMQEEMKEHGINEAEALKLVQDHLKNDKQYYSRRQGT